MPVSACKQSTAACGGELRATGPTRPSRGSALILHSSFPYQGMTQGALTDDPQQKVHPSLGDDSHAGTAFVRS